MIDSICNICANPCKTHNKTSCGSFTTNNEDYIPICNLCTHSCKSETTVTCPQFTMAVDVDKKEFDPHGGTPHRPGAKMDAGKLSYNKIPPVALRNIAKLYNEPDIDPDLVLVHAIEPLTELIRLLTRGAIKYEAESWKSIPDLMNRLYDSGQRHREAHREGTTYDVDKIEDGVQQEGTGALSLVASLWAEFCRVYTVIQELKEAGEPIHIYDDRYDIKDIKYPNQMCDCKADRIWTTVDNITTEKCTACGRKISTDINESESTNEC